MASQLPRSTARASIGACLAGALLGCLGLTAVAGAKAPTLTVPAQAQRGQTAALSVNPRGARSCRLIVRAPAGRRQGKRLPGGRSYTVYLSISANARRGDWLVRASCAAHSSRTKRLKVAVARKDGRRAGRLLFTDATFRKTAGTRPSDFPTPRRRQNGKGAPRLGHLPGGRGGSDGGRGDRAIVWAMDQLGRTDFKGWCLRFVAYAFGQANSYATATIAANALYPRDGSKSAALAPRGSLVWFNWVDPRDGVNYGHVGISLGDGTMINALDTVRIEPIDSVKYWHSRYRGWTPAPISWPGRPGTPPAAAQQSTTPVATPPPPPPLRKVVVVDNRTTNGMGMRQDGVPLRLITKPWIYCGSRGCNINGTERTDGDTYDAAVCQTVGERTTNGNDQDPSDDANPERFESTRYYGIRLPDNTFGYANEVWIRKDFRGGLGLPAC